MNPLLTTGMLGSHGSTVLSVNVNKVALLRNTRALGIPSVVRAATLALQAGAHGITVHPRPDERHIRPGDVRELAALVRERPGVELNVEGNPDGRYLDLVLAARPHQATLVPDAPAQLTSDHGWDARAAQAKLGPVVRRLKQAGIRVSLFLDPDAAQVDAAAATGADRIELYTESYARAFGGERQAPVLASFAAAARRAQALGLGVNAGHDLNLANLGPFLDGVPGVLEVSIGHALVCEAFDHGLEGTVDRYVAIAHAPRAG